MELYNTRAGNFTDEERRRMIFKELQDVQEEAKKKSVKTSFKAKLLWWINIVLNLVVLTCAAVTATIGGINISSSNSLSNLPILILSGIVFIISGSERPLKLGHRGFYYQQASYRLKRIISQARDLTFKFSNFTNEEILVSINAMRLEMDDIDVEIYKLSMPDSKFGNDVSGSMHESPNLSTADRRSDSQSHIHIHIDSSESSPTQSPKGSRLSPQLSALSKGLSDYSKSIKSKSLEASRTSIEISPTIRSISEPNIKNTISHTLK